MPLIKLAVGDTVIMKKKHPCSSVEFKILRLGSDVKILCLGCGREIVKDRESIEKMIKKVASTATVTGE